MQRNLTAISDRKSLELGAFRPAELEADRRECASQKSNHVCGELVILHRVVQLTLQFEPISLPISFRAALASQLLPDFYNAFASSGKLPRERFPVRKYASPCIGWLFLAFALMLLCWSVVERAEHRVKTADR